MRKYTHETPFTHVYDKFEYYAEDLIALSVLISTTAATGLRQTVYEFQDLKDERIQK